MENLQDKIQGMFLGIGIGNAIGIPLVNLTPEQIQNSYGKVETYLTPKQYHQNNKKIVRTTVDNTHLNLAVANAILKCEKNKVSNFEVLKALAETHVKALKENKIQTPSATAQAVESLDENSSLLLSAIGEQHSIYGPGTDNAVATKIAPFAAWDFLTKRFENDALESPFNDEKAMSKVFSFTRMTHASDSAFTAAWCQFNAIQKALEINIKNTSKKKLNIDFKRLFMSVCCDSLTCDNDFFNRMIAACHDNENWENKKLKLIGDEHQRYSCHYAYPFSVACLIQDMDWQSLIKAINAGGDTYNNASLIGAIIGALHGTKVFPTWAKNNLTMKKQLIDISNKIYELNNR